MTDDRFFWQYEDMFCCFATSINHVTQELNMNFPLIGEPSSSARKHVGEYPEHGP
jgi:hypothetical protein